MGVLGVGSLKRERGSQSQWRIEQYGAPQTVIITTLSYGNYVYCLARESEQRVIPERGFCWSCDIECIVGDGQIPSLSPFSPSSLSCN